MPSVPPDDSYCSTWSRTHCCELGSYSPVSGMAPVNTAAARPCQRRRSRRARRPYGRVRTRATCQVRARGFEPPPPKGPGPKPGASADSATPAWPSDYRAAVPVHGGGSRGPRGPLAIVSPVPTSPSAPSPVTPDASAAAGRRTSTSATEVADRIRYLDEVMAEIDAEVRRRRASGDLPAGLERELDELFLEFSPGRACRAGPACARRSSLVDGSAYVDIAVPTASNKAVGSYVKRLIRKGLGWYMNFVVAQIVKFAWSVSRMFHVVVDHIEDLEATVEAHRSPDLPADVVPRGRTPARAWWAPAAVEAAGRRAPTGSWSPTAVTARWSRPWCAAGVDAYGVDPSDLVLEPALDRGVDVRAESVARPPRRGLRRGPRRHRADRIGPVAPAQRARAPARPGRLPGHGRRRPGPPLGHARVVGGHGVPGGPGPGPGPTRSTPRPGPTCSDPAGSR